MSGKQHNLLLALGSLFVCFLLVEVAYRIIDPYPYYSPDEIARTDHGLLTQYDSLLGWKGVPNGSAEFYSRNTHVLVTQNSQGFRDIDRSDTVNSRPAMVFLGDSFTWGYEVSFAEMFVNIVRSQLDTYEVFNLAHRGYGTDQSLWTFRQWSWAGELAWVVLMFSENDVTDNISVEPYGKLKPRYILVDDNLILTGVPVPQAQQIGDPVNSLGMDPTWKAALKKLVFASHVLHDIYHRWWLYRQREVATTTPLTGGAEENTPGVTAQLLNVLRQEVENRDGQLLVAFIPSKREIEGWADVPSYQAEIEELCYGLGIATFDPAPFLKQSRMRLYYRHGMHLNARGHRKLAEGLVSYLRALEQSSALTAR